MQKVVCASFGMLMKDIYCFDDITEYDPIEDVSITELKMKKIIATFHLTIFSQD